MWIKKVALLIIILIIPITVKAAMTDNIVAYYKFDNDTLTDALEVYNLTNNGTTTTTTAIIDDARNNTGANSIHYYGNVPLASHSDITINIWIKPSSLDTTPRFPYMHCIDNSSSDLCYKIYVYNNRLVLERNHGGGVTTNPTIYYSLPTNAWTMVTLVYNSTDVLGYINGTFKNNTPNTGSTNTGTINELVFYRYNTEGTYVPTAGYDYYGLIDEVGLWNRALTPTEIGTTLYNSGTGLSYPFSTGTPDTCTGTTNCIVTCGTNLTIATGNLNMNKYNISFAGTSAITYLLSNISNYTKINVGNCSVKLYGNKIY